MKKLLALLLVLSMVLSFAACGGSDTEDNGDGEQTKAADAEKKDDDSGKKDDKNETDNDTWEEFYKAYTDGISDAGDAVNDAIDASGDDMAALTYGMSVLNMSKGDLVLAMVGSFFDENEETIKIAFKFLVDGDVDYEEKGDTATLSYKDDNGNDVKYALEYNKKSGTAQLNFSDAETTTVISICVEKDYIAKTYYDKKTASALEFVYHTNGDVAMCWRDDAASEGVSLLKNASAAEKNDFGKSMENYMTLTDGVLDTSGSSENSLAGLLG